MAPLYTIGEIVAATSGRTGLSHELPVTAISIDSREVPEGALFVAIQGERFDGHDFVAAALAAGAVAALVSEERAGGLDDGRLIVVPDALQGLVDLARAARARSTARIVAVTGSAGKTTTKEAIRTVLQVAGETHFSIRSFNNHWGVPLMLARLPRSARFGVFEIGMNHAGEIEPLSRLVRPHLAVITTVAAAHLEFFPSVAAIAEAKAEIFAGLEPGGTALLNVDHDQVTVLLEQALRADLRSVVTYGEAATAQWRIADIVARPDGASAMLLHGADAVTLGLGVPGRHMLANAAAAFITGRLFGVPEADALKALAAFGAPEGRGETSRLGDAARPLLLIDESYNANAASMRAAMDVFSAQAAPGGRKVLVLGDMRELGAQGPELHRALAASVLATGADRVWLVGPVIAALAEALGPRHVAGHAQRVEDIADVLLADLAYGDAVMVKGSNGVRLGELVKQIRSRFG